MKNAAVKLYEAEIAGVPVSYAFSECVVVTDTGPHRRYGVSIEMAGETASFPDVFPTSDQARTFLRALYQHEVTPVTLGDIVYDTICR